jgi:2-methylcitrate dehydratase PrpD
MPRIAIKMYPGAHRHHFFVESALRLKEEYGFSVSDIVEIRCFPSAQHQHYNFTPAGYRPPNSHIARFSVPFLIAAAMINGRIDVQTFSHESIANNEILSLASKVTYEVKLDAEQPANRGHVLIRLDSGQVLQNTQSYIRGLPENPATTEDLLVKFRMNVEPVLGSEQATYLADTILDLEKVVYIGAIFTSLKWS